MYNMDVDKAFRNGAGNDALFEDAPEHAGKESDDIDDHGRYVC